ncbi:MULTISPECIES: UDP-N-acetylmuramoyl-tripeptide--D-alanyl-D-alanine ligase [unclassified Flavobacterium]|uniref:UDP-N-acetylmuramoyl-tripeptide--D-alanyl-D- alanine ligase n=1 Tax=unclassified Flavobacterium TaxID=196869 RepID=UPI001F14496A|nr:MULTISPECIES: UDP-N-acetylmuramoyl-tripeptide--D-alanyl-D-alanine ligase [unclassified Flavobacterium]UMY67047.1 UDP-N-acetylmuramoyl-tripeptide--D-alanyl-D-alanine ligase [Flavobacterium sp. HJ-32-4]
MEIHELHRLFLDCNGLSTDTRKIGDGSMFFALKGANFDANTFANDALSKGASYAVIDNPAYQTGPRTLLVEDALTALQELAAYHRNYLNIPIIALTGSNGKTTTKELIHAVLKQQYNAHATVGNLNNHIGVPLTLLSFSDDTEIGIVEMGANHQKEIEFLCSIATPDYGYITNFGKAHLEGFGGFEGVIKGKSELYEYLGEGQKTAIINLDDPIQREKSGHLRRITFGTNVSEADVVFHTPVADPFVITSYGATEIHSHLIGLYNASNIHAAIVIGRHFDIPDTLIKAGIEGYVPSNNRSQIVKKGSNDIILDAYNANPSSMREALRNLSALNKKTKYAVLGDMFELGNEGRQEHLDIVSLTRELGIPALFIGKSFFEHQDMASGQNFFADFDSAAAYLQKHTPTNATLLIKGSRGMALERLMDVL